MLFRPFHTAFPHCYDDMDTLQCATATQLFKLCTHDCNYRIIIRNPELLESDRAATVHIPVTGILERICSNQHHIKQDTS